MCIRDSCVLCSNGLLLLRSAIVRIPFRFNFYWGVIAPILCAVAFALSIVVRNSERACQK